MFANTSNHQIYNQWKSKSQLELKAKIQGNYVKRANKSVITINTTIKQYISGNNNNNLPIFQLSRAAITNTLRSLFDKVDQWSGVDIEATRCKLHTFQQYNKRADNWWNRNKAEWIGDYFFTLLFNKELKQYITNLAHNNCTEGYDTNYDELLLFVIMKELMHSTVKFKRSKKQPLILDQCYSKSMKLQQFFTKLGQKHSVQWVLPPNITKNKDYRTILRNYATNWIDNNIQAKLAILHADKIENINFGIYLCNQYQPHVQTQNEPCCCTTRRIQHVLPNDVIGCNCECQESDNIPLNPMICPVVAAPSMESPAPYYRAAVSYRHHPYAHMQTTYEQNPEPAQHDYDRVRGAPVYDADICSSPQQCCYGVDAFSNEQNSDAYTSYNHESCFEAFLGNNVDGYTETFTMDASNYNFGGVMSMAEQCQRNEDEMDTVFTNSVYDYSFHSVFD